MISCDLLVNSTQPPVRMFIDRDLIHFSSGEYFYYVCTYAHTHTHIMCVYLCMGMCVSEDVCT